jgi:hypothetical protein
VALEKRYQVFVSSTYRDLVEERQQVIQALLELNCFPCSMEFFPASDDTVWEAVQALIRDCDYYLVVVAGKYGTEGPEGISYTRKEYEYAVEIGKPVMAFLHKNPSELKAQESEMDPEKRSKLEDFRTLCQQRMCKMWDNPDSLRAVVTTSLVSLMKHRPAAGWVRGDAVPDESAAQTIARLHGTIEGLRAELEQARGMAGLVATGLARGNDQFEVHFVYKVEGEQDSRRGSGVYSWDQLIKVLAGPLAISATQRELALTLQGFIERDRFPGTSWHVHVIGSDMEQILLQFYALGVIANSPDGKRGSWTLTPEGRHEMARVRAIRRAPQG